MSSATLPQARRKAAHPGCYAIHSYHAAPVQVDELDGDSFAYRLTPGVTVLRSGVGDVLHFAETREEAAEWQKRGPDVALVREHSGGGGDDQG